jgi:hypothetical protein
VTFAFTHAECHLLYDAVTWGQAELAEGRDPGTLEDGARSEYRRLRWIRSYDDLDPDRLLAKLAALDAEGVRAMRRAITM